jgi:hypothetical protein
MSPKLSKKELADRIQALCVLVVDDNQYMRKMIHNLRALRRVSRLGQIFQGDGIGWACVQFRVHRVPTPRPPEHAPTATAGPARGLLRATSLARTAQQPPRLQPGERVIEAVGRRDCRTGRSQRCMGIALGGGQAAVGCLELERVALAALDGDEVRDTGLHAHTFENRALDARAPSAVGGVKCEHRGRGPNR